MTLVEHDACYIILATEICVTRSLSSFLPADDVSVVVPRQCVGGVQPGSDTAVCQHLGEVQPGGYIGVASTLVTSGVSDSRMCRSAVHVCGTCSCDYFSNVQVHRQNSTQCHTVQLDCLRKAGLLGPCYVDATYR